MTRKCSHCNNNGHNSRTCPNRGVKLFGIRLTDGSSIRKSASMGNLTHYPRSNLTQLHKPAGNDSPGGDTPDHGAGDGYASEDEKEISDPSLELQLPVRGLEKPVHYIVVQTG